MPERPHQLTSVVVGDPPEAWRSVGFDVDPTGRFRLGATTITCLGHGPTGFVEWALDGVDRDLDGLVTGAAASGVDAGDAPSAHPNGISGIDHVVVLSGDCERTIAVFEAAGLEVSGGRSTRSYGAPMRQTFFWAGDVIIEMVGPDAGEPTTDEPTTIFGLALVADDLDATAATLGALMGVPKAAVQAGRRIAGLRHRDAGIGLPVAVMSPHIPFSSEIGSTGERDHTGERAG